MQKTWKLVIYDVPAHRILRGENEARFWDIAIYDAPAFARPRALQAHFYDQKHHFPHFMQAKMQFPKKTSLLPA